MDRWGSIDDCERFLGFMNQTKLVTVSNLYKFDKDNYSLKKFIFDLEMKNFKPENIIFIFNRRRYCLTELYRAFEKVNFIYNTKCTTSEVTEFYHYLQFAISKSRINIYVLTNTDEKIINKVLYFDKNLNNLNTRALTDLSYKYSTHYFMKIDDLLKLQ